jgi:hypothetical protein
VSLPKSTDFDFNTGDFTVENWIYMTSTNESSVYISLYLEFTIGLLEGRRFGDNPYSLWNSLNMEEPIEHIKGITRAVIQQALCRSECFFLGGDFNYPDLHQSLRDHLKGIGLNQACDDRNTFKTLENGVVVYESKLDWIFTKNIHTYNYQVDVKETDHDILRLSFKLPEEGGSKACRYNYRKWKRMNEKERGAFNKELEAAATTAINISDFYEKLQDLVLQYLGPQAACRPRAPEIYMKQEVRQARRKYKRLLRRFRANGSEENWRALKEAKVNQRRVIRCQVRKERRQKGRLVDLGLGDIIQEFIHSKDALHHQKRILENPTEMVAFWQTVFHDETALHDHIEKMLAGAEDDDEDPDAGTWKRSEGTLNITADDADQGIHDPSIHGS